MRRLSAKIRSLHGAQSMRLRFEYYWTAEAKRACSLHKRALAMTRSYGELQHDGKKPK